MQEAGLGFGGLPSVLVVESDMLLCDAIADALRIFGCGVRTAVGGSQAAGILRAEAIDVVLADLDMAGRGFGDLARALDARPRVSVICFAGDVSPETQRRTDELRARACLDKPLTLSMLLRCVRGLAQRGGREPTEWA